MMDEGLVDPLDTVTKDPELIKEAQKNLAKLDVLVCGGCHEVFHFVEEFTKHKSEDVCKEVSSLKCNNEEKAQVWGFTLWKTKYLQNLKKDGKDIPSSWEVYKIWISLEQIQKDLWISAGSTIQHCYKISAAKIQEIGVKKPDFDKDPLSIEESEGIKMKTGVRTQKEVKEEYNVEKIVGKRFNPKKRYWEYEVKWENYTEVTWEPLIHLGNCKQLVQEFENNLKAEKDKDKAVTGTPKPRGRPRLNSTSSSGIKVQKKVSTPAVAIITTPGGRPQRTSKQKALDQVKAWCGNISDGEEHSHKRQYDDDDESDDAFEKRIKIEADAEDTEEEEKVKSPPRKVTKIIHTYSNGVGKKLPDNVLIPDAKGVVRISQKQLPSLSSGVYIMSKSSGIIKLDPAASKIATSGGQAIVKVSPKVGQTQIRIIKKDEPPVKRILQTSKSSVSTPMKTTKVVQVTAKPSPKQQSLKKDQVKNLKPVLPKTSPTKVIFKDKEDFLKIPLNQRDDDSDYGLEELEFPTDLLLPEPDSPPREFTLDPLTGKVVGIEYPSPSPEPIIYEIKKPPPLPPLSETESATEVLENIVKLAAAEITEEDLKPDIVHHPLPSLPIKKTETDTKPSESILNAALSNTNILQKTLLKPKPKPRPVPKPQPRIINQAVANKPRPAPTSPLVRNIVTKQGQIRRTAAPRPSPLPKPKFNIAPGIPKPQTSKQVVNKPLFNKSPINRSPIYRSPINKSPSNIARKIGNTTVYKATPTKPAPSPNIKRSQKDAVMEQIHKEMAEIHVQTAEPKPVISMPSLDEDLTAVTPKVPHVKEEVLSEETDLSSFLLAENEKPVLITGDDGTVYEVVGQNEDGQTILLAKDSNGQQQCLLVTDDSLQEASPGEQDQVMMEVEEAVEVEEEQPLVAQFLRSEPPSPGGTHKVVVMLPGGDVMVTQVTPEEYASLELDK